MRFPTMWSVRPAKPQISLRIHAVRSEPLPAALICYKCVKLGTEQHLEFLSWKGGCTGSSESTLAKIPHCWKSRRGSNGGRFHLLKWVEECPLNLLTYFIFRHKDLAPHKYMMLEQTLRQDHRLAEYF